MKTIYAVNPITKEAGREFTELVFKHIPPYTDDRNNVHPNGGWVQTSKPENTPAAAKAAEAEKAKQLEAQKLQEDLIAAKQAELITSVEDRIKAGVEVFDFKKELAPYLEATGKMESLGKFKVPDIILSLRKELMPVK